MMKLTNNTSCMVSVCRIAFRLDFYKGYIQNGKNLVYLKGPLNSTNVCVRPLWLYKFHRLLYSLYLKICRVGYFAKYEEKCMKQYRNLLLLRVNKYTNFLIRSTIIENSQNLFFSQNFATCQYSVICSLIKFFGNEF